MLTDYDIQRLSTAIVDNLLTDERFIKKMAKTIPKEKRMGNTTQVARLLGISRKRVCDLAPHIGGIRMGNTNSAHWMFPLDEVIENYITYMQRQ